MCGAVRLSRSRTATGHLRHAQGWGPHTRGAERGAGASDTEAACVRRERACQTGADARADSGQGPGTQTSRENLNNLKNDQKKYRTLLILPLSEADSSRSRQASRSAARGAGVTLVSAVLTPE